MKGALAFFASFAIASQLAGVAAHSSGAPPVAFARPVAISAGSSVTRTSGSLHAPRAALTAAANLPASPETASTASPSRCSDMPT